MSKNIAEQWAKITIYQLKKYNFLTGGGLLHIGSIKYTSKYNEINTYITLGLSTNGKNDYMSIHYIFTDQKTKEAKNASHTIKLVNTPCYYGGKRYWFVCQYCERRVGSLFIIKHWLVCRHCGNIAYASQNFGGEFRRSFTSIEDVEKAKSNVGRRYYNNKPTRKFRYYMKIENKFRRERVIIKMRIGKLYNDFTKRNKSLKK